MLDTAELVLRVRGPDQPYKCTFRSEIDGSVQYYAVNPARPLPGDTTKPALVLTLHGASVEAIGQAEAYEGKSWAHLVAPTNRRPYGFDWEDWGRLDALEVLDRAQAQLKTDPRRTYLTGHSMGGHGTWQIGATYPDRFAAIAPSAGWISFWSYGGGARPTPASPVEELLQRAANPSDTLALSRNSLQQGIYILHGSADDNVPPSEARTMREHLAAFHHDFTYFEQPGAGHWWDVSDEPGADCVDWPGIFDCFARHRLPEPQAVRSVEFHTADPGISAWRQWAGILAQTRALRPTSVTLRLDPGKSRITGTTENVARLALRLAGVLKPGPLAVELDGQRLERVPFPDTGRPLYLSRTGKTWSVTGAHPATEKNPARCGPFKQAFRNRMLFVYGTRGTPEENAWAFAKARFDAETFWYRGNGAVDMIADRDFSAGKEPDRNVVLYGNTDTNTAWKALLGDSPVQISRGHVRIGARDLTGDDLACLFIRPRPGSGKASVAAVSGSGL
ncbi:MAG TPA: prolyl oligopeptidase family serine peptidase, partial [Armatimonadota bacterium]|nr:prolyl oligopeptidase family serine peptidase [Armatimonadota bacterium]